MEPEEFKNDEYQGGTKKQAEFSAIMCLIGFVGMAILLILHFIFGL